MQARYLLIGYAWRTRLRSCPVSLIAWYLAIDFLGRALDLFLGLSLTILLVPFPRATSLHRHKAKPKVPRKSQGKKDPVKTAKF